MNGTPQERFNAKFKRGEANECWEWIASTRKGYGAFYDGERIVEAHIFAWIQLHNRKPGDGKLLRHTCNNKLCVNPAHLVEGSKFENAMDSIAAGTHRNAAKTHCKRGHKYTEENTYRYKGQRSCKACHRLLYN